MPLERARLELLGISYSARAAALFERSVFRIIIRALPLGWKPSIEAEKRSNEPWSHERTVCLASEALAKRSL